MVGYSCDYIYSFFCEDSKNANTVYFTVTLIRCGLDVNRLMKDFLVFFPNVFKYIF